MTNPQRMNMNTLHAKRMHNKTRRGLFLPLVLMLALALCLLPTTAGASAADVMEVTIGSGQPQTFTDFESGWNAAAAATEAVTVKLLENWTAASGSFGTGTGFGNGATNTGNIFIPSGKTITLDLYGHTIDRGLETEIGKGHVIEVQGSLKLTDSLTGGTITGGFSGDGGGVLVGKDSNNAKFEMIGGTISGNKAYYNGGGVYSDATFIMSGGTITNNISGLGDNEEYVYGGGVFVNTLGTMRISGTANITGNCMKDTETRNNVHLSDGRTIAIDGTLTSAKIGISTATAPTETAPVDVTGANDTDYSAAFESDNPRNRIQYDAVSKKVQLALTPKGAFVGDVTVAGDQYKTIEPADATITLTDYAFNAIEKDADAKTWFTNMPDGLDAKVKDAVAQDAVTVTISISGKPDWALSEVLCVEIPAAHIKDATEKLVAQTNDSATWNIAAKSAVIECTDKENNVEKYSSFEEGWNEAVQYDETLVTLLADWEADENGSFGTGVGFGETGFIQTPNQLLYVNLDLNGFTIDRKLKEAQEAGFVIMNGGLLTIMDRSKAGTGKIKGGWNTGNGGGIYMTEGAPDNILYLEGGTITGNRAKIGGGVYGDDAIFISNTKITGNIAEELGGGVAINIAMGLYLLDKVEIIDNKLADGTPSNLHRDYKDPEAYIPFFVENEDDEDEYYLKEGSKIGITLLVSEGQELPVALTDAGKRDYSAYFVSDDEKRAIYNIGSGESQVVEIGKAVMEVTNNLGAMRYADFATGWNAAAGYDDSTVKLLADWEAVDGKFGEAGTGINESGYLMVPPIAMTLDLNGCKIDRGLTAPVEEGQVLLIGGELTVKDGSGSGDGKITGGNNTGNGGGVFVQESDTEPHLTLEGGAITGNRAFDGGGVFASGQVTMKGGKITDNIATNATGIGGVSLVYPYRFEVSGSAKITDNTLSDGKTLRNVYLLIGNTPETSNPLHIGADGLNADAKIGITPMLTNATLPGFVAMTSDGLTDYSANFVSDDIRYEIFDFEDPTSGHIVQIKKAPYVFDVTGGDLPANAGAYTLKDAFALINADTAAQANYTVIANKDSAMTEMAELNKSGATVTLKSNEQAIAPVTLTRAKTGDVTSFTAGMIHVKVGTLNLESITLDGASTDPTGVAEMLNVAPSQTLNIKTGATLENNNRRYSQFDKADGSAICAQGAVNISGGTIRNNSLELPMAGAVANGAGIYVYNNGSLTITGGTITGNTVISKAARGGGIGYACPTITISGAPNISGNTKKASADASAEAANVFVSSGKTVAIDTLAAGAKIGITTEIAPTLGKPVAFTDAACPETDKAFFTSDNAYNSLDWTNDDGLLKLSYNAIQIKFSETDVRLYATFEEGWNAAAAATETVTVKLLDDWNAAAGSFGTGAGFGDGTAEGTGGLFVPATAKITLDLNGHSLDRGLENAVANGCVIHNKGVLGIDDSRTGGTITGGNNTGNGGGVWNERLFSLKGGAITGNKATGGGGIYNEDTIQLNGGAITENEATFGAGVASDTSIKVSGAIKITDNILPNSDQENNVYLPDGQVVSVEGALTSGAEIGVTTQSEPQKNAPIVITTESTDDYSSFFSSDLRKFRAADALDADKHVVQIELVPISATIADVTITGEIGQAGALAQQITLTLSGDLFKTTIAADTDVSAWFTNLPRGLAANIQTEVGIATATATIAISGTPERASSAPIAIAIPADVLAESEEALVVLSNPNAKWAITGASFIEFTLQPAASLKIEKNAASGSLQAKAIVDPAGSEVVLTWYACSAKGEITGAALGTGETFDIPDKTKDAIYYFLCQATSANADAVHSNVAKVTVGDPVTGIRMITKRTMTEGEEEYLTATLEPEDAKLKHLDWETSNDTIVTVKDGLLTAVAPGTAVITAISRSDAAITATCKVTVQTKEEAPKIETIIGVSTQRDFMVGKGRKLTLGKLYGGLYVWTSDDPSIVEIDRNGVLKGMAEGRTVVRGRFGAAAKTVMVGDEITISVEVIKKSLAVTKVAISPKKATLDIGATKQLKGSVAPGKAIDKTLTWTSSKPEVAVVDDTGLVTALAKGKTKITATASSGAQKSIVITVRNKGVAPTASAASSISISPDTRTQKVDEITTLNILVKPANADLAGLRWASADASIATVDPLTGKITGVAEGETTITATLGNLTATCRLIVKGEAEPEEMLTVHVDFLAIAKGKKLKLNALTGFKGRWSSDDTKIATVSASGILKAKRTGQTTLTFSVGSVVKKNARFMGKSLIAGDSVEINLIVVGKGRAVTKVTLSKGTTIVPGETLAITAKVSPKKAIYDQIFWRSENAKIATVDDAGVVTGVANGKVKIIATATSGKTRSVTITVSDKLTKLTMNKAKATLKRGKTYQLSIKSFLPAMLQLPTLTWTSSKETVATVDQTGLVTAIKKGKTTIYATDPVTGVKTKCRITVK